MKVFVDGTENIGWSLDSDREQLIKSIIRIGSRQTRSIMKADIIHNVSWDSLFPINFKNILIRIKRNTLATATNFISLDDPEYKMINIFDQVKLYVNAWISPSTKQAKIFNRHGIKNYYQPFYLDLGLFVPAKRKDKLCSSLDIPIKAIEGKIVIGSFQRDSLGADLSKPKWQKGPELLITLLKDLPKDRFVLLLAGPRRHYIIKECKRYSIPYFYLGREVEGEDIKINTLPISKMPDLYAITDIYLITSRSESGPKAALETTATKTFVMSTDVGLAPDFIAPKFVFNDTMEFKKALTVMINEFHLMEDIRKQCIEKQYENCISLISTSAMDKRLSNIYCSVKMR